jgi:ribosomal protein S18 acetylase RimI-like enzyme
MEHFINEVKDKAESIEIAVLASTVDFPSFAKTRRFYEKFGFKEVRIDRDYYAPGDDRGIMRLDLKQ